jgi:hypothetical protein
MHTVRQAGSRAPLTRGKEQGAHGIISRRAGIKSWQMARGASRQLRGTRGSSLGVPEPAPLVLSNACRSISMLLPPSVSRSCAASPNRPPNGSSPSTSFSTPAVPSTSPAPSRPSAPKAKPIPSSRIAVGAPHSLATAGSGIKCAAPIHPTAAAAAAAMLVGSAHTAVAAFRAPIPSAALLWATLDWCAPDKVDEKCPLSNTWANLMVGLFARSRGMSANIVHYFTQ